VMAVAPAKALAASTAVMGAAGRREATMQEFTVRLLSGRAAVRAWPVGPDDDPRYT